MGPSSRARSLRAGFAAAVAVAAAAVALRWGAIRSGDRPADERLRDAGDPSGLLPVRAAVERQTIGTSREGRAIEAWSIGDPVADVALLVVASIHGSEPDGTPVVEAFRDALVREPAAVGKDRVVIVPIANPDGFARRSRTNAAGVDLNRNFPADNRIDRSRFGSSPLSEPESRALHDLIVAVRPRAIVSIHQPLECVDFDGPGEPLAVSVAAACGLPVEKLGSRPGSLGAWFGETLGRPIVTLELPRAAPEATLGRYAGALAAALAHLVGEPPGEAGGSVPAAARR